MTSEEDLRPRTHVDYTVGWICALPEEQTASIAMLDHRHADLPKQPNDPNVYALGSINGHGIVITCLPKSKTGTDSAETVVIWMTSTFPSIKVGLSVGIGYGVPPKVRLGDVVVGTPIGQNPDVARWDFGESKKEVILTRTGSLNNPPKSLLTALTRLQTVHDLTGSKIPEYLNELIEKAPHLASKYLKSGRQEDFLSRSDYRHASQNTDDANISGMADSTEEANRNLCDRNQTITKPRDMRVHYGLIASGNQLIEDADIRDKSDYIDSRVLCIEMEAAGLMSNFPCAVIRGICNCIGSHENNDSQEHAAGVAAAFAKELLSYVQTTEVEKERPAKDVLEEAGENIAHMRAKLEGTENRRILDWLTPVGYGLQQSDYFQRSQPGTGRWLLESKEFQSWLAAGNQTLFCPGVPGAGKTILTSIVVDYLTSEFRRGEVGIAYIYCNSRRHEEQNTSDLLAIIVKQLAGLQLLLPESVKDLFKRHQSGRSRPSFDELYKTLQSVIALYSRVFILVDALDELPASGNNRVSFLAQLFNIQIESGINIFATSTPILEIYEKFRRSTKIAVFARNDDVRNYLDSQISESGSRVMKICREDFKTKITEATKGMFLLARLYFESLKRKSTPMETMFALSYLTIRSSYMYDGIYEETMIMITSQSEGTAELASLVLSWIVFAKRPLKALELQHALAFPHKNRIDEDSLLPIRDLVSICGGLVTIEKGSGMISLIHNTTQEYLERTRSRWFPEAEAIIAATCATYLSLDYFKAGPCETTSDLEERLRVFQLYNYAAHNWGNHARECAQLPEAVTRFLNSKQKVEASAQVLMVGDSPWKDAGDYPRQMTGLHLAAYFGVDEAVSYLIRNRADRVDDASYLSQDKGYHLNLGDNSQRTPLSYAAENGHEAPVKFLLATGKVYINSSDKCGRTALSYAAENGHEALVQLLLERGANTNTKGSNGRTLLTWADENRHKGTARLLLDAERRIALGEY
ncbi:purine and uridine phosphorylase [Trichoderma afarasin]